MENAELAKLLGSRFPGRKREIEELLCFLGEPCDFLPPLLIYGGSGTGKTSIVREAFRHLGRPYAYASCRSCHSPRILFESLINSLLAHVRTAETNYSSAKKCERASDFVEALPDACREALQRTHKSSHQAGNPQESSNQAKFFGELEWLEAETEVVYLIIDNVDVLRNWPDGSNVLTVLFKLPELTGLPQLGVLLISNVGPHAYLSGTGCREPVPLYFRDYKDEELFQILLSKQKDRELYSSFLYAVLKPFSRATRRVADLMELLEPLFETYCEPIKSGSVVPDEQGKRKLFSLISPHIRNVTSSPGLRRTASTAAVDETSELHLPLCSKYLLLAAYIASTNPSTYDATFFDTGGLEKRKRRRDSMSAMEKKDKELQEKHLKGPGSFSLERLLAIFSCIAGGTELDNNTSKSSVDVTAEVLMQLSTLVGVNLINQGLTDPLEGSPKYRCTVDEDVIHRVARSVDFPLTKYLYYN